MKNSKKFELDCLNLIEAIGKGDSKQADVILENMLYTRLKKTIKAISKKIDLI